MSDWSLMASQASGSGHLVEESSLDTGCLEETPGESRAGEGAYRYLAKHPGVGSVTDLSRGGRMPHWCSAALELGGPQPCMGLPSGLLTNLSTAQRPWEGESGVKSTCVSQQPEAPWQVLSQGYPCPGTFYNILSVDGEDAQVPPPPFVHFLTFSHSAGIY